MQPPRPLSPRSTFLCLLVLQAVQLGFVWTGLASAADVFNGRPYLVADYSVNFYWVERAVRFFEASGRGWGYDPFYCAGYPLSFVWNSAAPMQLMAMLFAGWLSPGAVIKLFTFAVALALPTVLYATGRNFGLTPRQALFATLLGQLTSIMGIHAWMLGLGMLTGYAISYWALFTLSVLTARLLDPSPLRARHFVTLSLIVASALLVHKTAAVILGPPCLLLLLILPWPRRAFLSGAALVAVGANLYWILPLLQFLPDKLFVESVQEWTSAETLRAVLHVKELWAPFGRFAQLFWLQAFLLCSAPFGLWMLRRSRPRTALLLSFTLAFLLGITYLGEHFYLARVVNAYRYIIPLYLLCAIPAALVADRMLPSPRRALAAGLAGLMLLLLPSFHHWRTYLPLTTEIPPTLAEVIEWIQQETDDRGRILLEDHGYQERKYARLDPYAATGFSRYVSAFTKRHFIGGPSLPARSLYCGPPHQCPPRRGAWQIS